MMVMVPPLGRIVCVVKVTVVVAVVDRSAFWSAAASTSDAYCTKLPARAGTKAPALQPSADVLTVRPVLLLATAGPVVNSFAAKITFERPTGKSATVVVHTMVNVTAVNVQVDDSIAVPDTGTRIPTGSGFPLK